MAGYELAPGLRPAACGPARAAECVTPAGIGRHPVTQYRAGLLVAGCWTAPPLAALGPKAWQLALLVSLPGRSLAFAETSGGRGL